MRTPNVLGGLFLVLSLIACSETVNNPVAPADTPTQKTVPAELVGTWLVEAGSMMSDFVTGTATFGVTADVTAVETRADGTGNVWLHDRLTGTNDCVRSFVVFDDDDHTLVFDFAAETVADFEFNLAVDRTTYVFPVVSVDAGALRVADGEGRVALLSRQVSLPDSITCKELDQIQRFDGLPAPQFFTDLVFYQGALAYSTSTQIETFSIGTHTLGPPLGPTSSRLVQTAEDPYLWTHCGCGGSRDAFKRTMLVLVDTVSSEDDMGEAITMRAMAYVPTTDRLWIHGRPFDDQLGRFYVMNTDVEPDLVEQQITFNRDLRALAYDGSYLWGIVTVATQTVVRIDPASGAVLESYEVPDVDVSWNGLTFATDGMYMLGTDAAGEGVLVRMTAPQAVTGVALASREAE